MWFREEHRAASFIMEAETENMQSRKDEVKMLLLMHVEEGNTVQQKKP